VTRIVISGWSANSQVTKLSAAVLERVAAAAGVRAELLAVAGSGLLLAQAWDSIAAAEPTAPSAMKTGR
jgi:hypothetical protein